MTGLCVRCPDSAKYPAHPESRKGRCAFHEAESALDSLNHEPYDMARQMEFALWTARAIQAGEMPK